MKAPARFLSTLLAPLPRARPLWLVGGALRDLLRGTRRIPDVDLVVKEPFAFGRALVRRTGGSFVALDTRRRICRVVLRQPSVLSPQPSIRSWDIAPLGRGGVTLNLARRDFTVNAMALDLAAFRERGTMMVIDPFGGRVDLRASRIRVVRHGAFVADPLRLLRAARLAGELGFSLDSGTRAAIRSRATLVVRAAPERRREELCRLLASRYMVEGWNALEETGLRTVLFWDEQVASGLGTIRQAQDALRWLRRASQSLHRLLQEEIEAAFRRRELFLLAAVLRSMEWTGERGRAWARELRFSRRAQERLGRLLDLPLTGLRREKEPLYRFLRQARDVEVEAVLLARMAGQAAWARRALVSYQGPYLQAIRRPLVTGRDLARLGLPPGPSYRQILESAREAQAVGKYTNRAAVLRWVRRTFRRVLKAGGRRSAGGRSRGILVQ